MITAGNLHTVDNAAVYAALHADADLVERSNPTIAAVQLLCTFNRGSLIRPETGLRHYMRPVAGAGRLLMAWGHLQLDARSGTLLGLSDSGRAAVLLACTLATGEPIAGLGQLLNRFDYAQKRVVLAAFYVAMGLHELQALPAGEFSAEALIEFATRGRAAQAAVDAAIAATGEGR